MAKKSPPSLLRTLRLVAVFAMLLAASKLGLTAGFYGRAIATDGIVLDFALNDALFNPETTPVIAYIDRNNTKRIAVPENALATGRFVTGQRIRILYDRQNPESIRLDTPIGIWGTGVIWLMFTLGPALILSFLIKSGGQRRPARTRMAPKPRNSSIQPAHIMAHDAKVDTDRPVVRRMR